MTREELEAGAEQADESWEKFWWDFNANRCPCCGGHGRVGLFACKPCGATGQRPTMTRPHQSSEEK